MKNLTEWYSPKQKPYREGVYQRIINLDILYSYWDGSKWYLGWTSPKGALQHKQMHITSNMQRAEWRGLKCHTHR
jgi:hypothetical protein